MLLLEPFYFLWPEIALFSRFVVVIGFMLLRRIFQETLFVIKLPSLNREKDPNLLKGE